MDEKDFTGTNLSLTWNRDDIECEMYFDIPWDAGAQKWVETFEIIMLALTFQPDTVRRFLNLGGQVVEDEADGAK